MADKYGLTLKDRIKAKNNGISYMTLRNRMKNNWDKEKAINTPLQKKVGTVKRAMETAEKNGISKYTFSTRIYKLGWSLEKASTYPVNEKNRGYKS